MAPRPKKSPRDLRAREKIGKLLVPLCGFQGVPGRIHVETRTPSPCICIALFLHHFASTSTALGLGCGRWRITKCAVSLLRPRSGPGCWCGWFWPARTPPCSVWSLPSCHGLPWIAMILSWIEMGTAQKLVHSSQNQQILVQNSPLGVQNPHGQLLYQLYRVVMSCNLTKWESHGKPRRKIRRPWKRAWPCYRTPRIS